MAQVKFKLDGKQFRELSAIAGKFGGDLGSMVENGLEEKESPDYLGMSLDDLEREGGIITVDKSILSNLDDFVQSGIDAKDWYNEMNKKVLKALGDSDGCLFLILFAIFSPRNRLATNFRLAAQVYMGMKRDIEKPETRAELDQAFNEKSLYDALKKEDKYKGLKTMQGLIAGARSIPTYIPNLTRVYKMWKRSGYKLNHKNAVAEIAQHLQKSGKLGTDTVISAEKVFSFTLNLLDPSYQTDGGWLPATMDTWMAAFFYPHLSVKERPKVLGKAKNYVYMAKLTQQLASRYGMKPQEMQAVIWVAMIRKEKGPNYVATMNNAIEQNLKRVNARIEEIKKLDDFFAKSIQVIGSI